MNGLAFAQPDFPTALVEAHRQRRLLAVQFLQPGRPLCQAMEQTTLRHPAVTGLLEKRFVSVRLDSDREPGRFMQLVGGKGALALVVTDDTADAVAVLAGFADGDTYLQRLVAVLQGYPALLALRQRYGIHPQDGSVMVRLAKAYETLGSVARAEALFTAVLRLARDRDGSAAIAHERLARYSVTRGRNQEARLHLRAARLLASPRSTEQEDGLLLTEALVEGTERNVRAARRLLEVGLARFPGSPDQDHRLFALGTFLHELNEDPAALTCLQTLLRERPRSPFAGAARQQIAHIQNPTPDHTH